MKRKLIKQANQAYTVTLPVGWIREHSLQAGDEVEITQHERRLIITTNKQSTQRPVDVDARGFSRRQKYTYINALYARGVDEIRFRTDRRHSNLSQTLGYAIIGQEDDVSIIRDIGGVSGDNLEDIFKRVFQMIIAFYRQAIDDILGKRSMDGGELNALDGEINTFSLFLQRAIMKQANNDDIKGKVMFAYAVNLEQIGDEVLRMWREQKTPLRTKGAREVAKTSLAMVEKAFTIYFQKNPRHVAELTELKQTMRENARKLFSPSTAETLMRMVKIGELAADLTHLSLMRT